MRAALRCVVHLCILHAAFAPAQDRPQTEAQGDGFLGQIRSASSRVETYGVQFDQPEGPAVVFPLPCNKECEFDKDGSNTRFGEILPNGRFFGETIVLVRDGNGQVTERTVTDFATGQVTQHEWLGPFGKTEHITFVDGKVFDRQVFTYDRLGHLADRVIFDAAGNQREELTIRSADDGSLLERSSWGNDGGAVWRGFFDARTDASRFETFDPSGALQLTRSYQHGRVTSFWAVSDEPNQFGSTLTDIQDHGNSDRFSCHKGGACDVDHVHYEYADAAKQSPTSAEWRDSDGKILYEAYYEYEFDSQRNWVRRKVWVISPDLPKRTLYETDSRMITYWDR